jgi:hypothetical protein
MANSYITYIAPKEKFVMVSNSIVDKYNIEVVGVYCPCLKPPVVEKKTHMVIVPQHKPKDKTTKDGTINAWKRRKNNDN